MIIINNLEKIHIKIEKLRKNLHLLIEKHGDLQHSAIITASKELDIILNDYIQTKRDIIAIIKKEP